MIELLAVDLDGTVLDENLTISPAVQSAIERVRAAGVYVTVITGRMFSATLPYARKLGVSGPIGCYQGAAVFDASSGAALYEEVVPNAVLVRLYERAKSDGFHLQMYMDDRFYVEEDNTYAAFYARLAGMEPIVVDSLLQAFAGKGSVKVNMNADPARIAAYEPVLRQFLGEEAYVTRSLPEFLEVMNPKADKGIALRFVAEHFNVSLDRTLAIGDSYNDIPMLKVAGIGVAMGSAPEEVRAVADAVVGDWHSDGVARGIERFILEQRL